MRKKRFFCFIHDEALVLGDKCEECFIEEE